MNTTKKSPLEITHTVTFRKIQDLFDRKPGADLTLSQIQRALGVQSLRSAENKNPSLYYKDRDRYDEIVEENRKVKRAVEYLVRRGWLAVTYGSVFASNSAKRYHVRTQAEREADRKRREEEALAIAVAKALGGGDKWTHDEEEEKKVKSSGAVASHGSVELSGEGLKKIAEILKNSGLM